MIDYEDVLQTIVQAAEDYDLRMVGFDPYLSADADAAHRDAAPGRGQDDAGGGDPAGYPVDLAPMKEMETLIRTHEMLQRPQHRRAAVFRERAVRDRR